MFKKAVAATVAAVSLSTFTAVPANAIVVEVIEGNCRFNFNREETELTNIWNPFFVAPGELEEIITRQQDYIDDDKRNLAALEVDTTMPVEEKTRRIERLTKRIAVNQELLTKLQQCQNPEEMKPAPAPAPAATSSDHGITAAIAGVAGAIFGALAAILVSFPQLRNLIPGLQ